MEGRKRVVVTGMGVVSALGNTLEQYWNHLLNGDSGVRGIRAFDSSAFRTQIAAEIDFDPLQWLSKPEANRADRYSQLAQVAGILAIEDSGLKLDTLNKDRSAVYVGTALGGILEMEEQHQQYLTKGPKRISPFLISKMMTNSIAGDLSIRFGFHGSNYTASSACASAAHAMGQALHAIRSGHYEVVLTGGSEAPVSPLSLGGFCAVKALSPRNGEPQKASRPFDQRRDGFVLGEGAGILIFESLEHAVKRGARIYGEVCGAGFTADAHHITDPHPEGTYATQSMRQALEDGGNIPIEAVSYVNAHGTSTLKNDAMETKAVKGLFGTRAKEVKINSTKSMTGHLLGAAAAIEGIATLLSLYHQKLHPTANYEFPDPDCDLDYCPKAQDFSFNYGLSNSFGFGGHNVSLLFGRSPE